MLGDETLIADGNDTSIGLSDTFDPTTLFQIEAAFEGWSGEFDFEERFPDERKRFRAIMNHIIKNDGECPPTIRLPLDD